MLEWRKFDTDIVFTANGRNGMPSFCKVFVGSVIGLILCASPLRALEPQEAGEKKSITLDWIYKKSELGIKPVDPDLPRSLQWSKDGHSLAYLVSSATEAPHLVVYDPARDATAFCITPYALHDALIALASHTESVPIFSATQVSFVPEDATAVAKISNYQWIKDEPAMRLRIKEKKYRWNVESNLFNEDEDPEASIPGKKTDLTFSPNERYAAYTRDNNLYAYDTGQKKEIQLTRDGGESILNGRMTWVYWEELHYRRSWRAFYWSPNNDAIAYLQFDETGVSTYPVTDFSSPIPKTRNMFYPKAGSKNPLVRLGVVSLSTRETRWIDLGEPYEYIARVAWHPEGKILAVQTLNRAQDRLTLLFADPSDGTGRIILEETNDAWVNAHGGPFFLEKKEAFLWLSERSGYRHLYRYSNDGKKVKQLTKGDWEANPSLWTISIPIDEEKGRVYFSAAKDSPLERHVYFVSLNGGRIRRLTKEQGTHRITFSSDKKYAIEYFNSLTVPNRIRIINYRGGVVRALGETKLEDYSPYHVQTPELVELERPDGLTFYGRILKPYDFDPNEKYPVIVYVYGGPASQVVTNGFVSSRDLAIVNRGFVLFSFDTRGTSGRGRAWVNAIHRNGCDIPLEDLQFAVEYLKSLPYIDPDRMGIWGWSNGGYMTCCAMLKTPGTFLAGVAVAPLTDYNLYDTIYTERYMGLPQDNADGYKQSAAGNFAEGLEGSLMIAHGVSDDNVHIQNVYSLVDALVEAGKDYELYVYPQRDHGIGGDKRRYHLYDRMLDFFERKLGGN